MIYIFLRADVWRVASQSGESNNRPPFKRDDKDRRDDRDRRDGPGSWGAGRGGASGRPQRSQQETKADS